MVFKGHDTSWHDLISAQTSNVCITHLAALNAIGLAYIVCVKRFVMLLPAISLGDWFSVSRKGGTEGGGTQRVKTAWLCVGLAIKIPQWGHCINGPGKQSSHFTGPPCSVQF